MSTSSNFKGISAVFINCSIKKDNGGIPAEGNTTSGWQNVTNAKSENPEYH